MALPPHLHESTQPIEGSRGAGLEDRIYAKQQREHCTADQARTNARWSYPTQQCRIGLEARPPAREPAEVPSKHGRQPQHAHGPGPGTHSGAIKVPQPDGNQEGQRRHRGETDRPHRGKQPGLCEQTDECRSTTQQTQ